MTKTLGLKHLIETGDIKSYTIEDVDQKGNPVCGSYYISKKITVEFKSGNKLVLMSCYDEDLSSSDFKIEIL